MLNENDIKIFQSERMTDTDDGGGRITGNIITSGQENNIFPDISRLDRVYGRVSLRKIFAGVDSENTDVYFGSHAIVTENPTDPAVSISLFSTKNWDDTREKHKNYVESYLSKAGKWFGNLYETQIVGQKVITVWQRESVELPSIGSVWVLTQNEGLQTEYSQYVRIVKYTEQIREFFENTKRFTVRILSIEISDPLLYTFVGNAPTIDDKASPSNIRTTIAVDSAKYYGCRSLAQNASVGDLSVYVDSIFNQLVPSSQSEIPAVDVSASSKNGSVVDSSSGLVSFSSDATIGSLVEFYLGNGCTPGTLSMLVSGGTITDDGGDLKINGTTIIGTIDYSAGLLNFNISCPTYTGTKTISFRPASSILVLADTASIIIDELNRGFVYTMSLNPLPNPGSLFVDYRAQGKWYRLTDKGNGILAGLDSSYGSGTVNYSTGSVIITLGALPDVNTNIIFYWATPSTTFNRSNIAVETPTIEWSLEHEGIAPSTLTIGWNDLSVSDNGDGDLTGDGTGTINYATGLIRLKPSVLPLGGTSFLSSYQYGEPLTQTFNAPLRGEDGRLHLTLEHDDVIPKSVKMVFNVLINDYEEYSGTSLGGLGISTSWIDPYVTTVDNGSGSFFKTAVTGSIDYNNGLIEFIPDMTLSIPKPNYTSLDMGTRWVIENGKLVSKRIVRNIFTGFSYIPAGAIFPIDESGIVTVKYRTTDTINNIIDEEYVLENIQVDLTNHFKETVVPTSIRFDLGSKTYFDKNGTLYHSLNVLNGSATLAGTINYDTGLATITNWASGTNNIINLKSLLTEFNVQLIDEVTFRTAGAPIRTSSLYIQAIMNDGTAISTTSNSDGTITGNHMDGTVDYETGVVQIAFGDWVTAEGNESEDWYHEENLRLDGKVFKSLWVLPNSIKYNCVIYTYLPLDANLLGINPVRLPMDGKVPVFKKGDIAVIHDTRNIIADNPLIAGTTIDCNRERLARIEVQDQNKVIVSPTLYETDLDAGTITFNTPLNLTEYSQPLKILHTIEDTVLLTDVEINGKLSINKTLSHEFDKSVAKVSSALVLGDLFARWTNPFSQGSWTSVWSNTIIGSQIIPQYNYNSNPIHLTNKGSIQQRWALIFTSSTDFRIVGETLGQIGTGSINTDCSPSNPNNNEAYFILSSAGWGGGWSAGNVLRFNIYSANYPIEIARTILQSNSSVQNDSFRIGVRGDIDY